MSTDAIKVQEKTQKEWKNGKLWNALFWSSSARDRHPDVLRRGKEWKNGKLWNALFWSSSTRDRHPDVLRRGKALYFRVRASFSLWVWGFRKAP